MVYLGLFTYPQKPSACRPNLVRLSLWRYFCRHYKIFQSIFLLRNIFYIAVATFKLNNKKTPGDLATVFQKQSNHYKFNKCNVQELPARLSPTWGPCYTRLSWLSIRIHSGSLFKWLCHEIVNFFELSDTGYRHLSYARLQTDINIVFIFVCTILMSKVSSHCWGPTCGLKSRRIWTQSCTTSLQYQCLRLIFFCNVNPM
jgi:hypothetical protein